MFAANLIAFVVGAIAGSAVELTARPIGRILDSIPMEPRRDKYGHEITKADKWAQPIVSHPDDPDWIKERNEALNKIAMIKIHPPEH